MSFDTARAIDLIVAAGPGGVLNTPTPLPTDGLLEWWRCGPAVRRSPDLVAAHGTSDCCRPDGPFPVTVGRWEEIHQCSWCGVYAESGARDGRLHVCKADPTLTGSAHTFGAIVQTGVVSGPSHQADGCWGTTIREGSDPARPWYCHPDGEYGMYHTSARRCEKVAKTTQEYESYKLLNDAVWEAERAVLDGAAPDQEDAT